MKKIIKEITWKLGLEIRKYDFKKRKIVTLKPDKKYRGNVLLAYIIDPFLLKDGESMPNTHTHHRESLQMAETFLNLGYSVDVISYLNSTFIPQKKYSFFVAARTNFQKIAELLNKDCIKITHLDTAHWLFNNSAAYKRYLSLQQKKGVTVETSKIIESNLAIEYADYATVLGNRFTISTYSYAKKPIFPLSVPTCTTYSWPEDKNYEKCRKHYLWCGSHGAVNKGLDLVLEAFTDMPDYQLTVCGPVNEEKTFENAFYKELYNTSNIHTIGWIDVCSPEFIELTTNCIGLIYPSCSEGQAGAVVTCIQAGLIPIVSYESGVDVDDFGVTLKDCSVDEIKNSIRKVSALSVSELKQRARKAWEYARANHTIEKYAGEYQKIIEKIMTNHNMKTDSDMK